MKSVQLVLSDTPVEVFASNTARMFVVVLDSLITAYIGRLDGMQLLQISFGKRLRMSYIEIFINDILEFRKHSLGM